MYVFKNDVFMMFFHVGHFPGEDHTPTDEYFDTLIVYSRQPITNQPSDNIDP